MKTEKQLAVEKEIEGIASDIQILLRATTEVMFKAGIFDEINESPECISKAITSHFFKESFYSYHQSILGKLVGLEKTLLVVVGEHTIGYIDPSSPLHFGIFHASGLRRSPYSNIQGFAMLPNNEWRLATEKDFEDFNVSFEPYKDNENFLYKK